MNREYFSPIAEFPQIIEDRPRSGRGLRRSYQSDGARIEENLQIRFPIIIHVAVMVSVRGERFS
jgi:hypothetical protein